MFIITNIFFLYDILLVNVFVLFIILWGVSPLRGIMSVGNYLAGSKLSQEQLKEVRRLLAEGVKPKEIKSLMKIGLHAISNIKAGKVG